MQPQYLDQYGSWYAIEVDGKLIYAPALLDGSYNPEEWTQVE